MITRREFVKASSVGLVALACQDKALGQATQARFWFRGLIAFAVARPKGTTGIPPTAPHIRALLVRNTDHPHRELIVPGSWVNSSTPKTFDITDCTIEVETGSVAAVTVATKIRKDPNSECPVPGEWWDVSWIANLERVTGRGEVDPSALMTPTSKSTVTAQMRIRGGGTFRSGPPTPSGAVDYSKQIWDMQPTPAKPYKQPFTDSVFWDTGQTKCRIQIVEANGKVRHVIDVDAVDAGQILVTNLPPSTVRNPNPTASIHFAHYYDLLPRGASPRSIPHKDGICPQTTLTQLETDERLKTVAFLDQFDTFSTKVTIAAAFGDPLYCENTLLFETV